MAKTQGIICTTLVALVVYHTFTFAVLVCKTG